MSTFYDAAFAAIARQILVVWPDIKPPIIAVPQLQHYNWQNLVDSAQVTFPVAVIRFGMMQSIDGYGSGNRIFDIPVDIFFVANIPDSEENDLTTINTRLILLDANLQAGGAQDLIPEIDPTKGFIDASEKNELASLFLAHNYDLIAGQLQIVIRTGYTISQS
jgi:hypothetical protein